MAASASEVPVDLNDCMGGVTLRLRIYGLRRLRVRLWLLSRLLELAELVSGMVIVGEIDDGRMEAAQAEVGRRVDEARSRIRGSKPRRSRGLPAG